MSHPRITRRAALGTAVLGTVVVCLGVAFHITQQPARIVGRIPDPRAGASLGVPAPPAAVPPPIAFAPPLPDVPRSIDRSIRPPPPAELYSVPAASPVERQPPPASPVVAPPAEPPRLALASMPKPAQVLAAAPIRHAGGPGIILIAEAGDTMRTLYTKVYRGVRPPSFADVETLNPEPFRPGLAVLFPTPPDGWARQ